MTYDFDRIAPLDFAFIDGGHDFEHVLNDSRKTYGASRSGRLDGISARSKHGGVGEGK